MQVDQNDLVTLLLVDFKLEPSSSSLHNDHHNDQAAIETVNHQLLRNFLTRKLREPAHKIFSLDYKEVANINLGSNHSVFYTQISRKYNVLIVSGGYNLQVFNLETRKELFDWRIDCFVNYIVLDGNDLFVGCSDNTIRRYDFDKVMLDQKVSESSLIWKSQPFKYLWGFGLWREWIYVCDFDVGVFALDRNCGVNCCHSPKLDRPLRQSANIAFIPHCNEMIVCGLGFVEIFTLSNDDGTGGDENDIPSGWKSKVKIPSPNGTNTLYSIFYERSSDRIFVTDSRSTIFTLDRMNLNVVKTFEILNSVPGMYGVFIDEGTGYCYVCKTSCHTVTIYE